MDTSVDSCSGGTSLLSNRILRCSRPTATRSRAASSGSADISPVMAHASSARSSPRCAESTGGGYEPGQDASSPATYSAFPGNSKFRSVDRSCSLLASLRRGGPLTDPTGRQTRVLVVDDEPNISALLSATLRLIDFDVRAAGGGNEALLAAAEFDPDLVVLDVMLPDLDGFQVAQRLRAAGRPVPVLFLTARDSVEDRISGLTVGGDDYVTKPFSLEEVVLRIRAILRRTHAEPSPAADDGVLRYADLEMDEDAHEVRRGGKLVE